ncbi:MAG: 50S ribosomal protein L25 [bacterium]
MEKITLNAELRDSAGKSAARGLRRQGQIPGVVYRAGNSQTIKLNRKEVVQFINSIAGEQVIVNLKFPDGDTRMVLLKQYQTDPIRGELLHTDFFEVSMQETLTVTIPVITVGESIGVKRDGGVLQHIVREIEIEALPDKIPGHIDIDISGLEIGSSIHVSDIPIPEGVKILNSPEEVIVNVIEPQKEEEVAPAAAPEITEPEVEKKGKKEEEPAEEEKK